MKSTDVSRRIALALSVIAVITVGASAAGCADTKEKPSETTAPTQSSGSPTPSPTNKAGPTINPTGPNSFTPSVLAPPAPTALPGNVVTGR